MTYNNDDNDNDTENHNDPEYDSETEYTTKGGASGAPCLAA